MYIAPSSTFKFCSGVPLTKTYEHVGYWSSESAQYNAIVAAQADRLLSGRQSFIANYTTATI